MGITKLAHLIHFDAPESMRNKEIGDYSGKINALQLKCNRKAYWGNRSKKIIGYTIMYCRRKL